MHLRVKRSLHASICKLYYYLDSRGEIRKTSLVSSPASVSAACRRKQDRRLVSAGYTWMQHDHTRQTNPTFCQIFHSKRVQMAVFTFSSSSSSLSSCSGVSLWALFHSELTQSFPSPGTFGVFSSSPSDKMCDPDVDSLWSLPHGRNWSILSAETP